MLRLLAAVPFLLAAAAALVPGRGAKAEPGLTAGVAGVEITPDLKAGRPVYLAGFGKDRKATAVNDPLMARAVVLGHGEKKIAVVSVDVIGLFLPFVEGVRKRLPGYTHVVVSSTHSHDGPDTMGLWGPGLFRSGVDPDYMKALADRIVAAVRKADAARVEVDAEVGRVAAPELLHDSRLPLVKHDELVVLAFTAKKTGRRAGIVVQWNCHPETLGGKNTLLSSDYVGHATRALRGRYGCSAVYLTGTVGGLMTSLGVPVKSDKGVALKDGTVEKTARYGELLAAAAGRALARARPVRLTPFAVRTRAVYLPLDNAAYVAARNVGVLAREAFAWKGDPDRAAPLAADDFGSKPAVRTEVGHLRLGELDVACIPGEIYPELVLGKVQAPADPGADFPDAPAEPAIYKQLSGPHRMVIGLANDEVGYVIPKRQWDAKPPYCYGRKSPQYGEVNSLGPETAPLLCRAFAEVAKGRGK